MKNNKVKPVLITITNKKGKSNDILGLLVADNKGKLIFSPVSKQPTTIESITILEQDNLLKIENDIISVKKTEEGTTINFLEAKN